MNTFAQVVVINISDNDKNLLTQHSGILHEEHSVKL